MNKPQLIGSLALAAALAACSAPTPTTPNAVRQVTPHTFAHEHVLDVETTDAISDKLWAQYNYQIAKLMGNPTDPNIQILETSLAISPTATSNGLDIQTQLELFAGNIPEWAPIYETSSHKVLDAYRDIVSSIKPGDTGATAETQKQFDDQLKVANAATDALKAFRNSKRAAWIQENNENQLYGDPAISYADYMKDYQGEADALSAKNKLESDKLQRILAAVPRTTSYVDALAGLNADLEPGRLAPAFTFLPNITDTIGQWTSTGAYVGKPAAGLAPAAFQMASDSETTDYTKTTWSVSGSGGGLFCHASASASSSKESLLTTKSTYNMSVNFTSMARVLANPVNIKTTLLSEYRNGPWQSTSAIAQNTVKPYGKDGLFPLMVTEMLVVYNPSITMKMDESSYRYAKSTMEMHASGSYGWGAFGGSASASSTEIKTQFDDANASITIQDISNIPKIVAVRTHPMP